MSVSINYFGLNSKTLSWRIQCPTIFRVPPDTNSFTFCQMAVPGCIWHLHNKLVLASQFEARTDVVTQVNQLFDCALHQIVTAACLRIDTYPFWSQ